MTNAIALWLGAAVVAAILADISFNQGAALLFLLVKLADMIEWLAFWR